MSLIAFLAFSLAVWQLSRAFEKKDLIEKSNARGKQAVKLAIDHSSKAFLNIGDWEQQRVLASGFWIPHSTIYLDNRSFQSRPGVHVISAFKLDDNKSVLWVNRGWAPKLPGKIFDNSEFVNGKLYLPNKSDEISNIEGIAYTDLMKRIELTKDSSILQEGSLWQNLDWSKLHSKLQEDSKIYFEKIWPFILWQTSNSSDDLKRSLPIIKVDVNKHIGYAVQWVLLCLVSSFFAWRIGRN
tara:strand:- start:368 stop:1087 length:720 start_codon:yes stop_codon:yes gene_type:complete